MYTWLCSGLIPKLKCVPRVSKLPFRMEYGPQVAPKENIILMFAELEHPLKDNKGSFSLEEGAQTLQDVSFWLILPGILICSHHGCSAVEHQPRI